MRTTAKFATQFVNLPFQYATWSWVVIVELQVCYAVFVNVTLSSFNSKWFDILFVVQRNVIEGDKSFPAWSYDKTSIFNLIQCMITTTISTRQNLIRIEIWKR